MMLSMLPLVALSIIYVTQVTTIEVIIDKPQPWAMLPPYRSFLQVEKPSFIDDVLDQQLRDIVYHNGFLTIQDLYQYSELIHNELSSLPYESYPQLLNGISQAINAELQRQGYLDFLNSYNFASYSLPYNNIPLDYMLHRRAPDDGLISSMVKDAKSYGKAAYDGLYNVADYLMPHTTKALSHDLKETINELSPNHADSLADKLSNNVRGLMNSMF